MQVSDWEGKIVAVTGSCGTVGAELVRQLVESPAERIICLDNNESELFFQQERYRHTGRLNAHLADVRDVSSLRLRTQGTDVIIHAAALKHVGLCEDSPNQAMLTNIVGTQNVIEAALANKVGRVIFTSSDKAVNPTNVMGTSKLMGERLMTAANQNNRNHSTIFASTRFGNVLGSRGSVLPLFRQQIAKGGPITLTDARMTRFVMTLQDSAKLVLESVWLAHGGEVFITKMPIARIEDIAHAMRDALAAGADIEIVEIGTKPGEKMYEELMNEEEVRRSWEYGDFFVVLSPFADTASREYVYLSDSARVDRPYNSALENTLSRTELTEYMKRHDLF